MTSGVPTDGRDGATCCWRALATAARQIPQPRVSSSRRPRAAALQSIRRGCRARGGPGRHRSNPSAAGVELEEAQGGAGALGRRCLLRFTSWPARGEAGALEPSVGPCAGWVAPCRARVDPPPRRRGACESNDRAMGSGGQTGERGRRTWPDGGGIWGSPSEAREEAGSVREG
jgi:hypothetical protein